MSLFAFIGSIGPWEWGIMFLIVLLVFGPKRLPQVAEALGKSIQKFKRASKDAREEIESEFSDPDDKKE